MDEQARQQAFVSALVTEHFVLQSARSTTVTEANGRAAIYLTSVSSALVAFGFVAQVANQLDPFMAAVLPALFVLGVFTFIRLVENSIENLVFLEQIQRIRGYYAGLVPEARAFFASGTRTPPESPARAGADGTDQGEMAAALASTGIGASRVEMLFTAASMVGAVNSILGGVGIALLVRWAAGIDTAGAVLVGVVATPGGVRVAPCLGEQAGRRGPGVAPGGPPRPWSAAVTDARRRSKPTRGQDKLGESFHSLMTWTDARACRPIIADPSRPGPPHLYTEVPLVLGFTTRQALRQTVDDRSNGRLHLDPAQAG
jgi:hypothetical protein